MCVGLDWKTEHKISMKMSCVSLGLASEKKRVK